MQNVHAYREYDDNTIIMVFYQLQHCDHYKNVPQHVLNLPNYKVESMPCTSYRYVRTNVVTQYLSIKAKC